MDIDLARTFLEIARTGSFIAAAERLHITQTTVTARVQNLERQLGCRLFVRNRSGASLTDNGERFAIHASQMVQTWDAARRELPLADDVETILRVGGEISLWNPLLLTWVLRLRDQRPKVAVRAEVGDRRLLQKKLEQGVIDAVLVHQPDYWPGMQIELLLEEKLVKLRTPHTDLPYVYVDWGEIFRQNHDAALPELARAAVTFDLGPLALQYLLQSGGSGYFRTRVAQPYIEKGLLERVASAPEFNYPIYLVYSRTHQSPLLDDALLILHETVETLDDWRQFPMGP